MDIEMDFFLREMPHVVNWDSRYVVTSQFSDFLGVHEGKCIPIATAEKIHERWQKWVKSDGFKNGFAELVQTAEYSGAWKKWVFGYLKRPSEARFSYSLDELLIQLAENGEVRIEILEKELRRMAFDLNQQFQVDSFDSSERKRAVQNAMSFCEKIKPMLYERKIWAVQYWNYFEPNGWFMKGQFMDSFVARERSEKAKKAIVKPSNALPENLFVSPQAREKAFEVARKVGLINDAGNWIYKPKEKHLAALWRALKAKNLVLLDIGGEGRSVQLLAKLFGTNTGKNTGTKDSDEKMERELKALLERE